MRRPTWVGAVLFRVVDTVVGGTGEDLGGRIGRCNQRRQHHGWRRASCRGAGHQRGRHARGTEAAVVSPQTGSRSRAVRHASIPRSAQADSSGAASDAISRGHQRGTRGSARCRPNTARCSEQQSENRFRTVHSGRRIGDTATIAACCAAATIASQLNQPGQLAVTRPAPSRASTSTPRRSLNAHR